MDEMAAHGRAAEHVAELGVAGEPVGVELRPVVVGSVGEAVDDVMHLPASCSRALTARSSWSAGRAPGGSTAPARRAWRSDARSWRTSGTNRLDRLKTEAEAEERRRAHGG